MNSEKLTATSRQDLEKMFSELRFESPPLTSTASAACFHGLKVRELNPIDKIILTEDLVGKGVFNPVYRGKCRVNKCELAVKKINMRSSIGKKFFDQELRNNRILMESPHDNIVKFFGCCDHERERYFIFELGDLSFEDFLMSHSGDITIGNFNEIVFQILEAQDYLKKIKMKHNDCKFKNMVFFKAERAIKLIDFERALVEGDPRFSSAKSVLPFLGKSLGQLQATIKHSGRIELEESELEFSKAFAKSCKNEFNKNDFDLMLSDVNIWNPDLSEDTKKVICLCFLAYTAEGEDDALKHRSSLSPRETLNFGG